MSAAPHPPLDEPCGTPVEPLLYQLVYCSRAAPGLDDEAVHAIIRTARRHNAQHGITGLLVFGSGVFFQWLEGPRVAISTLMARLQTDPRHADIVTLDTTEEPRERLFPNWAMELVSSQHIAEVLRDAADSARDAASAATLHDMLRRLQADGLDHLADR